MLVRSDSRSVVSYINHQGGLVSKRLCALVNDLLVWAQTNLRSERKSELCLLGIEKQLMSFVASGAGPRAVGTERGRWSKW